MSEKKSIGNIDVKIGDGNTIGHIGHKIVFKEPPPDPNAIWQDGQPVGALGGAPTGSEETYNFPKLFFDRPFDVARDFEVQGVRLRARFKSS